MSAAITPLRGAAPVTPSPSIGLLPQLARAAARIYFAAHAALARLVTVFTGGERWTVAKELWQEGKNFSADSSTWLNLAHQIWKATPSQQPPPATGSSSKSPSSITTRPDPSPPQTSPPEPSSQSSGSSTSSFTPAKQRPAPKLEPEQYSDDLFIQREGTQKSYFRVWPWGRGSIELNGITDSEEKARQRGQSARDLHALGISREEVKQLQSDSLKSLADARNAPLITLLLRRQIPWAEIKSLACWDEDRLERTRSSQDLLAFFLDKGMSWNTAKTLWLVSNPNESVMMERNRDLLGLLIEKQLDWDKARRVLYWTDRQLERVKSHLDLWAPLLEHQISVDHLGLLSSSNQSILWLRKLQQEEGVAPALLAQENMIQTITSITESYGLLRGRLGLATLVPPAVQLDEPAVIEHSPPDLFLIWPWGKRGPLLGSIAVSQEMAVKLSNQARLLRTSCGFSQQELCSLNAVRLEIYEENIPLITWLIGKQVPDQVRNDILRSWTRSHLKWAREHLDLLDLLREQRMPWNRITPTDSWNDQQLKRARRLNQIGLLGPLITHGIPLRDLQILCRSRQAIHWLQKLYQEETVLPALLVGGNLIIDLQYGLFSYNEVRQRLGLAQPAAYAVGASGDAVIEQPWSEAFSDEFYIWPWGKESPMLGIEADTQNEAEEFSQYARDLHQFCKVSKQGVCGLSTKQLKCLAHVDNRPLVSLLLEKGMLLNEITGSTGAMRFGDGLQYWESAKQAPLARANANLDLLRQLPLHEMSLSQLTRLCSSDDLIRQARGLLPQEGSLSIAQVNQLLPPPAASDDEDFS